MRVAIDARRLQDRPLGGVGRIVANLLPYLADEVEVIALTDARRPVPEIAADVEVQRLRVPPRVPENFWLHISAPAWLRGFDGVFHGTFNAVPILTSVPSVVSIWDLSFEHHPEDHTWGRRNVFRANARFAARRSRRVLVGTQCVAEDIVATYGVARDRIIVTPCAVDPVFREHAPAELDRILAGVGLRRPYVVAVGGATRRGLAVAVAAWERVRLHRPDLGLAVVGERPAARSGLTAVGGVDDPTWAAVLAGAEALVYPTRFEGFGMPALEAAASGTPVVCAPLPPLVEVLGDAAAYAGGTDVDAITTRLQSLLDDSAERTQLRVAGLARAAAWSTWKDSARLTVEAYRAALNDGPTNRTRRPSWGQG